MSASEEINELSAALAKAQGAMKAATFNRTNPHFKSRYADMAAVLDAIREPFASNGLSVTQVTEIREGGFVLVTTLRHASGQWLASEYPLPAGAKPQELGSALTYARRYSLSAMACIAADEDDDAEGAHAKGQTSSNAGPRRPAKPAPNVMVPPHDADTGEIIEQPSVAKMPSAAAAAPSSEAVLEDGVEMSVLDMAREAAEHGEEVFKAFYKMRSKQEQKQINGIGDELRALMAEVRV